MESFLVAAGLVVAAFVAGVVLADKVKAWFKTEEAAAVDKVKSKL